MEGSWRLGTPREELQSTQFLENEISTQEKWSRTYMRIRGISKSVPLLQPLLVAGNQKTRILFSGPTRVPLTCFMEFNRQLVASECCR